MSCTLYPDVGEAYWVDVRVGILWGLGNVTIQPLSRYLHQHQSEQSDRPELERCIVYNCGNRNRSFGSAGRPKEYRWAEHLNTRLDLADFGLGSMDAA